MFHPLMIINQLLSFFSIKNSCHNFYIIYTGTPLSAASFMQLFQPTLTSFALNIFKSYFFFYFECLNGLHRQFFFLNKLLMPLVSKTNRSELCFVLWRKLWLVFVCICVILESFIQIFLFLFIKIFLTQ